MRTIRAAGYVVVGFARIGAIVLLTIGTPARTAGQTPPAQMSEQLLQEADSARKQGRFAEAIRLAEAAVSQREAMGGPPLADALNTLGRARFDDADYGAAALAFERSLEIRRATLAPDASDVGTALNNLASAYRGLGELAKAAAMYTEALEMQRRTQGDDTVPVAISKANLGSLYTELGDFARAQPLLEQALATVERHQKPDDPMVARMLNTVGQFHGQKDELEQAEHLFRRSLDIRRRVLPANHPDTARALNVLASVLTDMGRLDEAEPLHREALGIFERSTLGPDHPLVGSTVNNLAVLTFLRRDFAGAEPLYKRALEIRLKAFGPWHEDVAAAYASIAAFYWTQGRADEAVSAQLASVRIRDHNLPLVLARGSEAQKLAYVRLLKESTDITLSMRAAVPGPSSDELAASVVLRRRARVLDAMTDTTAALRRDAREDTRRLLDELGQARGELARLSTRVGATVEQRAKVAALDERVQSIEASLSQASAAARSESRELRAADVAAQLPPDTALIEYVRYAPFDPWAIGKRRRFGSPRYAAFVLARDGAPKWIELGPADDIEATVTGWRNRLATTGAGPHEALGRLADAQVLEPVLARLAFRPRRLLVVPDGPLALAPFEALRAPSGRYRDEEFEVVLMSSGRDLLRLAEWAPRPGGGGTVVFADPDYGSASDASAAGAFRFTRLPGTAAEARAIARVIPTATVWTGPDATESRLKGTRRPRVLHVATHGFFISGTDGGDQGRGLALAPPAAPETGRPLERSGLAFAGANSQHVPGADDGLLTPLEVAGLELEGTQLVVLSACETGLGDVLEYEGVQGLRRALVVAGSASQVMSLWRVDDAATSQLMAEYYRGLADGLGRSAALQRARSRTRARVRYRHPSFWAGFVFAGDWRPLPP